MKRIIYVVLLSFLVIGTAFAEKSNKEIFQNANRYFLKENYKEAQTISGNHSDGFISSNVYFNLGNCYFREKDYGKAILFYERAKRLDPSNESINLNLKIANLKIVDKIKPIPEFFITKFLKNLAKSKSADTFSWLGILFIWIGFIFLTALFMNNKISIKKLHLRSCRISFHCSFFILSCLRIESVPEEN